MVIRCFLVCLNDFNLLEEKGCFINVLIDVNDIKV